MTDPREIKAIAGNSASCLGFAIALPTGSSPVLLATEKGPESKGSGPFVFRPAEHDGHATRAALGYRVTSTV